MSTQPGGEPQTAIAATDVVVAAIIIERLGLADKVDALAAEQYKSALGTRIVPIKLATQAFLFVGRQSDATTLSEDMLKRAGVVGADNVTMVKTLVWSNGFIFDRHRSDNTAELTTPSSLVASPSVEYFISIQVQVFRYYDLYDNNTKPCPVGNDTWNNTAAGNSNITGLSDNFRPGNGYDHISILSTHN